MEVIKLMTVVFHERDRGVHVVEVRAVEVHAAVLGQARVIVPRDRTVRTEKRVEVTGWC